ncbi:threonine--tRNA ligase [Peredibacter starrii]|uniref:Threonine--tRNA ligase n=1 Tax=Peredibacter starrii TaxID=28202 RepID=A0AAX4HU53_9BACT|nr:threonine--tRNA ligase [Peredibacter starrii]WPU66717.1 threonine--tRNA ligase [Peredibacter starrii]
MMNEFDHRVLGAKYDLFSFFEEGPGFPVWHEKGLRIKNALIEFWRKLHAESGYVEIQSPIMLDKELWKRSGHCDYFEENMYFSSVDKRDFAIKPMNCPGAILVFNQKKRSHAELPLRICELGHVHRHENSGSLHGLMRVRSFVQDDAHIFCNRNQLLQEIKDVIRLIEKIMNQCGLKDYHFELSLRGGEKEYLGSDEDWAMAEGKLEEALRDLNYSVKKNPGEAKFYGPSLDLHLKDVHGRSWQCSSVQLDFNLPKRFNVHYFDEKGERQVPYMLHRAIYGSLERFIGILLENYGKDLPFWFHPVQYKILNIAEESREYSLRVASVLRNKGFKVELDLSDRPLKEKIRRAHDELIHSLIIIGKKEMESGNIVMRSLKGEDQKVIALNALQFDDFS